MALALALTTSATARAQHTADGRDYDLGDERAEIPPSVGAHILGDAAIYARYARSARGQSAGGLTDLVTVGFDGHAFYGHHLGYAAGLGFALGGGVDGAFAYDLHFSPAGFGVRLGDKGYIIATFGVGFDGATSRIPLSFVVPADLVFAFDLAHHVRLGMNAGLDFTTSEDRRHGVRQLGFGDELDLGTFVRIGRDGHPDGDSGFASGRGYFVKLDRKAQLGTSFIGLSIGLELDVGFTKD